ncbi:MAG: helix-turn-helix domain-containing protein [Eubacterium sp.]
MVYKTLLSVLIIERVLSNFQKGEKAIRNTKDISGNYFVIPNDIFEHDLKPRDIAVYCYLKKCAGVSKTCFPSERNISKKCNISTVTVATAIKALDDAGLIDVMHRYDGNAQLSNLYTILKI